MFRFSLFVLALVACQQQTYSLEARPCDMSGACVDGYVCDPTTNLCVATVGGETRLKSHVVVTAGGGVAKGSTHSAVVSVGAVLSGTAVSRGYSVSFGIAASEKGR